MSRSFVSVHLLYFLIVVNFRSDSSGFSEWVDFQSSRRFSLGVLFFCIFYRLNLIFLTNLIYEPFCWCDCFWFRLRPSPVLFEKNGKRETGKNGKSNFPVKRETGKNIGKTGNGTRKKREIFLIIFLDYLRKCYFLGPS